MTSYTRRNVSPVGGRRSPYTASSAHNLIRESDYEYVEADPHTLSSRLSRRDLRYTRQRPARADDDNNAPDVIILRHLNQKYPILFKPFAIGEGLVSVGDIRYFGAQELGNVDPRRLKLIYKGKELKHDNYIAKTEGLKQRSEITVVVSATETVSRNHSDEDAYSSLGSDTGRKVKSPKKATEEPIRNGGVPIKTPSRDPSPLEANDPMAKVEQLAMLYSTQWAPASRQYLAHPPDDTKAKDFEHKRLTESILNQIIFKADAIEMHGDKAARAQRKALVIEAQEMLRKLDATVGKRS